MRRSRGYPAIAEHAPDLVHVDFQYRGDRVIRKTLRGELTRGCVDLYRGPRRMLLSPSVVISAHAGARLGLSAVGLRVAI